MTTSSQYFQNIRLPKSKDVKEQAHLYDINNNPKILPEKYAVSKATLNEFELYYDHTPNDCIRIIQEAKLPMTP